MTPRIVTRPAYFVMASKLGGSWYAEIEINGRLFAAVGATLRDCAAQLAEKAGAA